MINVISGETQSGKTTRLVGFYNEWRRGDGYALVTVETNGIYTGQDIVRLSDKQYMPFSRVQGFIPEDWDEGETFDRFSFSQKGMNFAKDIMLSIVKKRLPVAFIDDIGPLEISGHGVHKEFSLIIRAVPTVFVTVRNDILPQFVSKYIFRDKKN